MESSQPMTCRAKTRVSVTPSGSNLEQAELDLSSTSEVCRLHPQLLISVRSGEEVEVAIESGVDIVDLKEPRDGALSPTDSKLWQQVAQRWAEMDGASTPPLLSAALGEPNQASQCAGQLPSRFDFAKAGPSGCSNQDQLRRLWTEVRNQLDERIELVAVAYADWQQAGCVAPESVLQFASEFGLNRCLLDTFGKDGRSSLDIMAMSSLSEFAKTAKRLGMWWALAGSIRRQDIARLRSSAVAPDCLGVRGDVCEGSRSGNLNGQRIQSWLRELRADRD